MAHRELVHASSPDPDYKFVGRYSRPLDDKSAALVVKAISQLVRRTIEKKKKSKDV